MVKKKISKKESPKKEGPKTYPKWFGLTSLILAVVGFFFLLILPQVSLVLFLIGGIFGYLYQKEGKTNLVLNVVGFVLGVLWMLVAYYILLPIIASAYGGAL